MSGVCEAMAASALCQQLSTLWQSCPCSAGFHFSISECASNCFNTMVCNFGGESDITTNVTHIGGTVSNTNEPTNAPQASAPAPATPAVPQGCFASCVSTISGLASNLCSGGGTGGSRWSCSFGQACGNLCNRGNFNCCGTTKTHITEHTETSHVSSNVLDAGGGTGFGGLTNALGAVAKRDFKSGDAVLVEEEPLSVLHFDQEAQSPLTQNAQTDGAKTKPEELPLVTLV